MTAEIRVCQALLMTLMLLMMMMTELSRHRTGWQMSRSPVLVGDPTTTFLSWDSWRAGLAIFDANLRFQTESSLGSRAQLQEPGAGPRAGRQLAHCPGAELNSR